MQTAPVRRFELVTLLTLALVSALWCVTSAAQLSATFDEPIYLREGLARWRSGSTAVLMKYGTMPLPVDVQTFPLYCWERWRGADFDIEADFHTLLPWARAMTLAFWWLLLLHVWLAGRSLAGPWAGLLAAAFVAVEPSLLAHASLATTDIALAACLVALVYHFQRSRSAEGWWRRVAWPALWFALAILAKASGLVFGVLCLFCLEGLHRRWWRDGGFRASVRELFQIGLVAMLCVFVYCGSDFQPQRSLVAWTQRLPEFAGKSSVVWIAENLRVFSNAGEGIVRQFTHNVRGHGSYLLGQTHPRALWYYFPVLLTIKVTLPILLAALCLGPAGLRRGNWALVSAFVLLLFSVACRVQIGIRFMFPLLCFAIIGLSAVLVQSWEASPLAWRRRLLKGLTLAGLLWTASEAALVWPHGLCYVNRLWGGTQKGYQVVSEANYDWGQGVLELDRWQRDHAGIPLASWHFCADPIVDHLSFQPLQLHHDPHMNEERFRLAVRGRYLAVSTTLLHGSSSSPCVPVLQEILRREEPVARTMTFLIYDFTRP